MYVKKRKYNKIMCSSSFNNLILNLKKNVKFVFLTKNMLFIGSFVKNYLIEDIFVIVVKNYLIKMGICLFHKISLKPHKKVD